MAVSMEQLKQKTLPQLREYAKEIGYKGKTEGVRKHDLVEALLDYLDEDEDDIEEEDDLELEAQTEGDDEADDEEDDTPEPTKAPEPSGDTYTAKQVATRIGTDAKTLRKFFRSSASTVEAVGQGGRYEFAKEDLPKIKAEFDGWNTKKTARTTSAGKRTEKLAPAEPDMTQEEIELDDEDIELDDEELDDTELELELDDEEED